jgi:FkbH-like protein
MPLRKSSFVHLLPVGEDRVLVLHAITHLRLVVDRDLAEMIAFFDTPREIPAALEASAGFQPLVERGILTEQSAEDELAAYGAELGATHGRDPSQMLEGLRRQAKEGGDPYWAAGPAMSRQDLAPGRPRLDALLLGDCDVHMESAFLRREAAGRGVDLRVAATFPDDLRLAQEHKHDVVLIGALRARHAIVDALPPESGEAPFALFLAQARAIIEQLRAYTSAPILIDNLPEPTVQPLGLAERGSAGHRNRFRMANVALADLVEDYADVYVVDVAAVLAGAGAERLLDDGQVSFTHFGSPGWMLQRPEAEKAAVYGLFPDPAPLIEAVGGDPYGREAAMARAHLDAVLTVVGHDRKKCVIVDLDGTLWPGVLAETGAPFAWAPDISGPFSYIGLFFGLHEALLALKRRGVLLACVSKNSEDVVRALWRYEDHYPRERLLTPDDFVTWRVNWSDKVDNIASIADELGFALEAFLFIDDHPVERDRVRQRLPQVEVWGEDPFALRRRLLTDPRLQTPRVTAASAQRTATTKAQLERQAHRAQAMDEAAFLASLDVRVSVERLTVGDPLERVEELFQRTTQFNVTGAKFTAGELDAVLRNEAGALFTARVSDRFGDHGLAGAAVVLGGEILGLALSCRVLGMGVEHRFLKAILEALSADWPQVIGRIVETARNAPARHLYRDNGFTLGDDGLWRWRRPDPIAYSRLGR